ncbi:MAG: PKD domain-containing protein, partial [Bacteroidales bacterium]|nr:PKD domain-containing protein [Bacteroidales bacterium]
DNTTGGSEWSWDFGDGETSTEKSPSHKYTQVGVFNAILTVTDLNSCLATSDPIKITKMNPLSSFGIESDDDGKFCLGSTVTLSESVVSDFTITDYLWEPLYDVSKETSRSESGNNLIIVYGETGEYPLSLTVKDEDGCIGKMEDTVKIGKKPVLPTIVTENKCYKDVKENGLDFTVTPNDDANNWYWDFGDNNKKMVYEDMVNHIYDAPKDYHVTVLAKQYYCPADMAEIDIIVKAPSAEFAPNPEAVCGFPGDITFDPSASQGAEKYLWDFGDGTDKIFVEALAEEGHFKWTNQTTGDVISEDSTSNVVVHTYQKSNKYDVKLVTSTDECEDDKTQTLNLSGILPGFVIDTMEVCMGVPVNFKDTSVVNYGSVASRRWIFGEDTVNADGATYAYAFSKAGTFDVSLKVENNFTCTDSLLKPMLITVYPLPEVVYFDEKNDNPYGCADFEVTFKSKVNKSSIDAEITGYLWNFGDGQASTEQVPTHTYAAGIFDVSLKITDEKNCTDELKKTQYIHSNKPSSEFQSEPLICYYTDFVPTIKSVEAIEYTWDWGDESTPTTSGAPDHSYSDVTISDTTYTVTLTAKDTIGCSTTTSKTVEVRRPISAFTASDSVFSCPPADVNFYNKSTGTNLTYLWNLPSTVVNPIWQFYTSGDYDITLTVTDDEGCSDIVTKPSYISISGPRGKLEINQTAGCTYDTIQFTGKDIFGATSRQWVFDDGRYAITDDVDSISYRYSIGGNYIPSLVLTDDNGCEVTVVGDKLTVYGVEFAFETDSILCEPTTVEIKNTSITIPIEADSWEWAFSTGDTIKTKDALIELGYGDFNMSLTANIGGCKYTMDSSSFLKILRTLDSQFETSQNPAKTLEMVTFTNTTDTAFGMPVFSIWDYGTGDTSSVFDGSHSYINAGDYTVSLTTFIHEECPNTFSMPITIVKEYLIPNVFTPNGDGINDRFLENMPEVELIILNRWGQQVYKGFDGWDGTFNGQEMSAGTYYYLITLPNGDHFEGPLMLIRN